MKKILVFYDSDPADLELAVEIAKTVSVCGFDPWLADNNVKRNWRTELESAAKSSICAGAVVVWTAESIENNIVRDEASLISALNLPLLGLLVDAVKHAPIGFGEGPRLNFSTSDKQSSLARLTTKIRGVFGSCDNDARVLQLGAKSLAAPGMVLSVSSFETQIAPEESLKLLKLAKPPAVLVSAYDLLRPTLRKNRTGRIRSKPRIHDTCHIHELGADGSIIFLDSGNYESMRYSDSDWHRSKKRIFEAQEMVGADLVFTHDKLPDPVPSDKASATERIDRILKEYERDNKLIDGEVAPIVHAPRVKGNGYRYDLLPEICCGVARATNTRLIAVAERELGDGLLKRVETIATIRKALKDQGTPVFLHVLGTGNPISTAFLSMAGADFFDGLEWCRTAIDGRRWRLYHFQQWDLLASQSGMIESDVIAKVVSSDGPEVPWVVKAALHNLAFFLQADQAIRDHHQSGELEKLLFNLELDAAFVNAREIINRVI